MPIVPPERGAAGAAGGSGGGRSDEQGEKSKGEQKEESKKQSPPTPIDPDVTISGGDDEDEGSEYLETFQSPSKEATSGPS